MKIKNNSNFKIKIHFPRWSHFSVEPTIKTLEKLEEGEVTLKFVPKNLGKIRIATNFMVIKVYPLDLTFEGVCIPKPGKVSKSAARMKKSHTSSALRSEGKISFLKSELESQLPSMKTLKVNRKFEYLKENRSKRLKGKKEKFLKNKFEEVERKVKEAA